MKVRVYVPVGVDVPYTVDVDSADPKKVREALLEKVPSDWDYDPDFYENLGSSWSYYVNRMSDDEVVENMETVED